MGPYMSLMNPPGPNPAISLLADEATDEEVTDQYAPVMGLGHFPLDIFSQD